MAQNQKVLLTQTEQKTVIIKKEFIEIYKDSSNSINFEQLISNHLNDFYPYAEPGFVHEK